MSATGGFWQGRKYHLDRMDLGDLFRAYIGYPAIQTYLALSLASFAAIAWVGGEPLRLVLSFAIAVLIYPLVWYVLHRFVLHGRFLCRTSWTAPVWKRIHFDHHQDPNDLRVLFGALYTTLPTIAGVTIPLGWAISGPGAAAATFAGGLLTTCFYEFCHCIQHLGYAPKWRFLKRLRKLHLAHHFHNEQGNFGITNFLWDRIFGTFYARPKDVPRSETVFNLGYTDEMAERWPWVAETSELLDRPPRPPRGFRSA